MFLNNSCAPTNRRKARGMTLIEVLVSIAIFSTLSVGAYQIVNQVQRSNEISAERSARLNEIQRALVMLDNDFRQMALRQTRSDGEEAGTKLLHWQDYLLDSDEKGVMFARVGWHNPEQQFPRGEVTKVGYRIKDNVLERVWWRYPDTVAGEEGLALPLLTGVEALDMQFFDGKSWVKEWDVESSLPEAVTLELTLDDYETLSRVYITPGGSLDLGQAQGENSQQGDTQ
ncbi:type II secretion system minor pseudopilin GspJ [Vibrio sp. SM6]|uniref:Type II secretion system protein J n=1 Tax=Vibrio agarilyticus TaxID=2726741 RepID=A0A7X8TTD6_9VIBR|nr:type II secretion system minor pseudopilin GspJ [Vibrio agarilyticus]NLS14474.1 type II secretion system minor pseudopilin GspJ [Vibrio agarilyticus]